MKKDIMLGVNSKSNRCCKLLCLVPFERIVPSEVEATDFIHSATNWCGNDEIKRTLELIKMQQTGNKIILDKPIVFHGSDYDCGREDPWKFEVNEIHELEELLNEETTMQNINWFEEISSRLRDYPDGDIWSAGCEILCKTEAVADALADMFECLYKAQDEEILVNTGYYDPVEDERNGELDRYTGWWYVNVD